MNVNVLNRDTLLDGDGSPGGLPAADDPGLGLRGELRPADPRAAAGRALADLPRRRVSSARDRTATAMIIDLGLPTTTAPPSDRSERLAAVRDGMLGSVHSWELVTAVDGPGTRLTIFLAGCALRCQYCHNPDTWNINHGRDLALDDVVALIDRYAKIMTVTGGGVTLSGGEPLLQPAFVARIFRHCAERGIHTALDTSGFLGDRASDDLLADTSLVLLDVKSGLPDVYRADDRPRACSRRSTSAAGWLDADTAMWIRFVLVPGLTDGVDNVEAVAAYAASLQTLGSGGSVQRVEVLPFHQLGRDKWHELGETYPLEDTEPPSPELIDRVRQQFRHGLTVPVAAGAAGQRTWDGALCPPGRRCARPTPPGSLRPAAAGRRCPRPAPRAAGGRVRRRCPDRGRWDRTASGSRSWRHRTRPVLGRPSAAAGPAVPGTAEWENWSGCKPPLAVGSSLGGPSGR